MNVETMKIINMVKSLPLSEKLYIIELIFKDLREQTIKTEKEEEKRQQVAQSLLADYQSDEELIAFTALDQEEFYETK